MKDKIIVGIMFVVCMIQFSFNLYQGKEVENLQKEVQNCKAVDYSLRQQVERLERLQSQTIQILSEGGWK